MSTTKPEQRLKRDDVSERRKRELESRKVAQDFGGGKLGVNPALLDTEKYTYRWINDQAARVQIKTKNGTWDLVPAEGGDEANTDLGAMMSRVVGQHPDGSPKRAYLVRKLKEYHEEDLSVRQEALDRGIGHLRRGADKSGQPMSDYVPNDGISL